MNADMYWTYSCLRSLQIRNMGTFFYSLNFIKNEERRNVLLNIFDHVEDEEVKEKLSKINHIIPSIIT